jgi:hypothetical protein
VPDDKRQCPKCGSHELRTIGRGLETVVYEYILARIERQIIMLAITMASMLARAAFLALLFGPAAPRAQPAPRLYAHTGYNAESARQLSLGGAYVGVADGAVFTANHASFAQPSRWVDTPLDVFFALQGTTTVGGQDLDNDGQVDRARVNQLLFGLGVRYRRLGFGLHVRAAQVCVSGACARGAQPDASFTTGAFSVAGAFVEDQLMLAAGLHGTAATLGRAPGQGYSGGGLGLDLLWRPAGQPYRLGVVYRPLSVARQDKRVAVALPGLPSAVTFPGVLSAGMSIKLDAGREGLNVPRERDDDPTGAVGADTLWRDVFRDRREVPPGRWLMTLQLDATLPVRDAVTLEHFAGEGGADDPRPVRVGQQTLFTPRFGVEHVTLPGRLRLRGGGYLEPSPTPGVATRAHGTFGFDLFLFHYLLDWGLTGALDVAPRLRQGSLSFGVWG